MTKLERLKAINIDNLDITYYIQDIEDVKTLNDLYELLDENRAFEIDIIYYSEAIKYLMEHDPSLRESMEIASEYGFETENINSELLASLLASQKVREDFYRYEDEINEILNEEDND
jgi:intracellular sulfur oxidation DsrE/DsrF family protein